MFVAYSGNHFFPRDLMVRPQDGPTPNGSGEPGGVRW